MHTVNFFGFSQDKDDSIGIVNPLEIIQIFAPLKISHYVAVLSQKLEPPRKQSIHLVSTMFIKGKEEKERKNGEQNPSFHVCFLKHFLNNSIAKVCLSAFCFTLLWLSQSFSHTLSIGSYFEPAPSLHSTLSDMNDQIPQYNIAALLTIVIIFPGHLY